MTGMCRTNCVALALAVLVACGGTDDGDEPDPEPTPSTTTTTLPTDRLQAILDGLVEPPIRGAVLAVRYGDSVTEVAAGDTDVDHGHRIASLTKTFTAAATLRLVEDGDLALDDAVADVADPAIVATLRADGYDPNAITVRHLLHHSSGLYDYGTDDDYVAAVAADLAHRWTRLEQIEFAMAQGDPVGPPGEQFEYADTGYVILGDVIERTTGDDLGASLRALIGYDELGLDGTYLESIEEPPPAAGPRSHQLFGDLDTYDVDPSFDLWGGGGLVAPMRDVARFYDALLGGEVFDDDATLETMLEMSAVSADDPAGMGIFVSTVAGETCFGHTGFWNVLGLTCPDSDRSIGLTLGQALADTDLYAVAEDVLALVGDE